MDVQLVRQKRRELEDAIHQLLSKFMEETTFSVSEVILEKRHYIDGRVVITGVKTELEL